MSLTKQNGRYNHFEGGSIYYTSATGAHPVFGAIRDIWSQAGWENSPYGYPTSDEYPLRGGFQQQFQNGPISWNVGPVQDADPNGTNAIVGADDPFNRFARRSIDPIQTGGKCSTADADGNVVCFGIGKAAPTPPDPTPNPDARRANPGSETPSVSPTTGPEPTTTQQPSSLPSTTDQQAPSASITPSTPAENAPTDLPETSTAACPSTSPTTTTSPTITTTAPSTTPAPPCSPEAAPLVPAETEYSTPSPGNPTADGRSIPQARVFPELALPLRTQLPAPDDPPRNLTAERAFFKEDDACVNSGLGNFWGKRFYGCGTIRYEAIHYRLIKGPTPTLALNAVDKGFVYFDTETNFQTQKITNRTQAVRGASLGSVTSGYFEFELRVDGSVGRTGTLSGAEGGKRVVSINPNQSVTWSVTTSLPPGNAPGAVQKSERDTLTGTMRYFNPTWRGVETENTSYIAPLTLPAARCDNYQYIYTSKPGCIVAPSLGRRNLPVLDMTTTRNFLVPVEAPQLWDHILTAQNSGVPGSPVPIAQITGAGRPLQRIPYDSTQAGQNRGKACPSTRSNRYKPPPSSTVPVWSCDEYPFASTQQGAAAFPQGGRTRDWCFIGDLPIINPPATNPNGWSACIIPDDMNNAGGRLLPSFNSENRILLRADDLADGYYVSAYH